jgi:hypothetical protein
MMGRYEKIVRALAEWHEAKVKVTSDEQYVEPGQKAWFFVSLHETDEQRASRIAEYDQLRVMVASSDRHMVFDGDGDFGIENACRKLLEKYVGPKRDVYFISSPIYDPGAPDGVRQRKPLIVAESVDELELKMIALGLL